MARQTKKTENKPVKETFIEANALDTLDKNMELYSEEVVLRRALPSVYDGCKPVHRRILYSMYKNKITSNSYYRKVAKITGDVMGNYHPHGDASISDAIVNLSQEWKNNIVTVSIEGNNGSQAGFGAAAPRYIEARLTKEAELMFNGLENKIVKFVPSYDNRTTEPTVLPARWPVLFTNGSSGIGIGFATNIPPHNVIELMKGAIYINKNEGATLRKIMQAIPGPDFPTGGIIVNNPEEMEKYYKTGEGKIVMRAKIEKSKNELHVTEIPFGYTTTAILQSIADAIEKAKIEDSFTAVEDESQGDNIDIAFYLKRGVDPDIIEQFLYDKTLLQSNFNARNICVVNNRPETVGLIEYLKIFVNFRRENIRNNSRVILQSQEARKHILEGFIRMTEFPDEIIAEVKRSSGKKDASERLQKKFKFTEAQADAIVTMQLYKISRTDVEEFHKESDELEKSIEYHSQVINDNDFLIKVVDKELKETARAMKEHSRRTEIIDESEIKKVDISNAQAQAELKKAQPCVITVSPYSAQRMTKQMYDNSKDSAAAPVVSVLDGKTSDAIALFTRNGLTMQRIAEDLKHSGLKNEVESFVRDVKTFTAKDEILLGYNFPVTLLTDENSPLDKKYVISITKQGQVKKNKLSDVFLSFNTKGYLSRSKPYNGLKLDGDTIIMVAILDEDKVDELNVSLKRSSGGRVTQVNFGEISEQGASGSGTNKLKITKPKDFATITTTNVEKLTNHFYVEK